jgi:2'-5' RNA ligase
VRLFIAVNLPSDVSQAAWEAASSLRANRYPVKWVPPESLHITMKFLGDVDPHRADEIVGAMECAAEGARPFPLLISGFGAFPNLQRPRVVWIGCEAAPPLELLQHRVEQEMDRMGFPIEGRPFHPHITLGRVRREARKSDFADFSDDIDLLDYATEVTVESLDLMESTLTPRGARYTRRHAVEFGV